MSIAGAIIGKDAMVLFADSRLTNYDYGEYRFSDTAKKCWRISKYSGLAYVGKLGYAQWLVELFKDTERAALGDFRITELVNKFTAFANRNFSQYANDSALGRLVANDYIIEFVLAGYTELKEPKIVSVCHHATSGTGFVPQLINERSKFIGLYPVSSYLVQKVELVLPQLGSKALKRLAVALLLETSKREPAVGGPMQMVVIPKGSDAYEVKKSELTDITEYVRGYMKGLDEKLIEVVERIGG